jgi:hypothetical protein
MSTTMIWLTGFAFGMAFLVILVIAAVVIDGWRVAWERNKRTERKVTDFWRSTQLAYVSYYGGIAFRAGLLPAGSKEQEAYLSEMRYYDKLIKDRIMNVTAVKL